MGVRVGWMYAMGWGFAASLGAVSGMMVAPLLFLSPTMMQATLIYAFAAAVLGGIESPVGAVLGGLLLGLFTTLLGAYVDFVSGDLELPIAFTVLIFVLLFRPSGLLGRAVVRRV
jgi:branched-chain amino acid transport system permease protein